MNMIWNSLLGIPLLVTIKSCMTNPNMGPLYTEKNEAYKLETLLVRTGRFSLALEP